MHQKLYLVVLEPLLLNVLAKEALLGIRLPQPTLQAPPSSTVGDPVKADGNQETVIIVTCEKLPTAVVIVGDTKVLFEFRRNDDTHPILIQPAVLSILLSQGRYVFMPLHLKHVYYVENQPRIDITHGLILLDSITIAKLHFTHEIGGIPAT